VAQIVSECKPATQQIVCECNPTTPASAFMSSRRALGSP